MAFCSECGKEVAEDSQFCPECGRTVSNQVNSAQQTCYQQPVQPTYQTPPQSVYLQPNLIQQLSTKIKTDAIIWIVIACLQFLIGIFNIVTGLVLNADYEDGTMNLITGFFVILVGIINLVNSMRSIKYSKEVLIRPVGIVQRFEPIGGLVGILIYNLLFGGIIGAFGSIYGFVLRNFVISHAAQFQAIESSYNSSADSQK